MDDVTKDGDSRAQGVTLDLLPPLLEPTWIISPGQTNNTKYRQASPMSGGWELREETETQGQTEIWLWSRLCLFSSHEP